MWLWLHFLPSWLRLFFFQSLCFTRSHSPSSVLLCFPVVMPMLAFEHFPLSCYFTGSCYFYGFLRGSRPFGFSSRCLFVGVICHDTIRLCTVFACHVLDSLHLQFAFHHQCV